MAMSAELAGLEALGAVDAAVKAGASLPEVARVAARALDASLVLIDRSSAVLAVANCSEADERSLLHGGHDVLDLELRVGEELVGRMRLRARGQPSPSLPGPLTTVMALLVERVRAPERASEEASRAFLHALANGGVPNDEELWARARELGIELQDGATVVVVRARPHAPTSSDWRGRLLLVADRSARSAAPSALSALASGRDDEVVLLVPEIGPEATGRRVAASVLSELHAALPGFRFAAGCSGVGRGAADLRRGAHEAVLAANVAESDPEREILAHDDLGTYRILLRVLMEDPSELQRFYAETVEPLVAYDEQYETDLVGTLAAFLECDANVNATAARLVTHRHTIKYRFERVRELTGLDVRLSDGREKLSMGLKAMRVLGIAQPRGPASEAGAGAGRVPRGEPRSARGRDRGH